MRKTSTGDSEMIVEKLNSVGAQCVKSTTVQMPERGLMLVKFWNLNGRSLITCHFPQGYYMFGLLGNPPFALDDNRTFLDEMVGNDPVLGANFLSDSQKD